MNEVNRLVIHSTTCLIILIAGNNNNNNNNNFISIALLSYVQGALQSRRKEKIKTKATIKPFHS